LSISVIIPAYNAAPFLAETIESVLHQTLVVDDILVVDDGSTDETAAIAASFPAPVRVISTENSKLGAARNFGISQVNTEWIAFVDADDLWTEGKLERQMAQLEKERAADICYSGYQRFSVVENEKIFRPPVEGYPTIQRLLRECFFVPSSVVARRSALLAVGGFSPDPEVTEDWDMWLRMLRAGCKFTSCPEALVLYRVHGSSITADGWKLLQKETRVYREQILPQLSGVARLRGWNRFLGEINWRAAYAMRARHDARCIPAMTKSIMHLPFADAKRYKVLAHMIYTRLTTDYFKQRL
jgi:glycosyltransferase involved in cell wall biosynthesis